MRKLSGFAVAWMLVLVAIIAMAGGAAAHDVLFAQQLAGSRAQQQRAMSMAELGLRIGVTQLSEVASPVLVTEELHLGPMPADSVQTRLRPGAVRLAEGFSAGRFVEHDYEIESTGRSIRNAQRVLVQGMTRLEMTAPTP